MRNYLGMRALFVVLCGLCLCLDAAAQKGRGAGLPNPFYAMDTGTDALHLIADEQAAMVKALGFDGMDMIYRDLPKVREMVAAVDKHGIKLIGIYFPMQLMKDKEADLSRLGPVCEALKGRDTLIMMPLYSKDFKPGTPEGEATALATLRAAAKIASRNGLRVAIYPHAGAYAERVEVAARLARQADRPNVGMMFNLCHFLKTDGTNVEARVKEVMPVMFAFTICGADKAGVEEKGWARLIMTLDQGDYDVADFVALFLKEGYKGPIGLQHYGIKGDARENLARSMTAWKKIAVRAAQAAQ